MQVMEERMKIPRDLLAEMRKVSSDVPTEILVPYFEADTVFAPLKEMEWHPECQCLAFAMGNCDEVFAFDVSDNCIVELLILGDSKLKYRVNSSLVTYRQCVTAFIEGIPYNDPDTVPFSIKARMNAIEPGSADEGTFWMATAWDAGIGEWTIEALEIAGHTD